MTRAIAEARGVPYDVLSAIEEEARVEFPQDSMMMELHILRAVKRYDFLKNRSAGRGVNLLPRG